jgi:hypothetical protein
VKKEMVKKRIFNNIIQDFKNDLEKSKKGNIDYNKPLQITIERIESFCNCFIDSFVARYKREPFLNELNKLKNDLRKSKKIENNSQYDQGVKLAIDKIKDLQENLLYEHEKNPKSTLYYKDIL